MCRFFQQAPRESGHQITLMKFASSGITEAAPPGILAGTTASTSVSSLSAVDLTPPYVAPERNDSPSSSTNYTPLSCVVFSKYLVAHVTRILTYGADIGYRGARVSCFTNNSESAREHSEFLERQIATEVTLKHCRGPFLEPPFPNFVVSVLGVAPKSNGKSFRT